MSDDARADQPVCDWCGRAIFGGPGGWHDRHGQEVCDGGSDTSFHEPSGATRPRAGVSRMHTTEINARKGWTR